MTAAGDEITVLFADIAGSTRITEEAGDVGASNLLSACLDLMDEVVRDHGGTVSRRIGDELLCLFPSPESAAGAASALHWAVSGGHENGRLSRPMRLRIGFEHGQVVQQAGELFGQTVHTAARLSSLAKAGQTLVSKQALERIEPALRLFARYVDSVTLKGLTGTLEVHELPWSPSKATQLLRQPTRRSVQPGAVELRYEGVTYRIDANRPRLEIGRDPACDLRVPGSAVSMVHARVVWEPARIRIEDVSTNGTRILRENDEPTTVHRGAAALTGAGELFLGGAADATDGATLEYRCHAAEPGG